MKNIFMTVVSIFTLLVLMALPKDAFAEGIEDIEITEGNESIESTEDIETTARNAAIDYISAYERVFFNIEGNDFEIELVRELYHSDDSILAYYYHVKENGDLKGFILVSAKRIISSPK